MFQFLFGRRKNIKLNAGVYRMVYPFEQGEVAQIEINIRREKGSPETAGFRFTAPKTGKYAFWVDSEHLGILPLQK